MIDLATLDAARAEAAQARRRLVEVLEERLGMDPDAFVAHLGSVHKIACIRMAQLREYPPAFDLLPFSEAAEHGCVLVRDPAGALLNLPGQI